MPGTAGSPVRPIQGSPAIHSLRNSAFIQGLRGEAALAFLPVSPIPGAHSAIHPFLFVDLKGGRYNRPRQSKGFALEADVAQLVEQLIRNQQVIGSSPIVGSI